MGAKSWSNRDREGLATEPWMMAGVSELVEAEIKFD